MKTHLWNVQYRVNGIPTSTDNIDPHMLLLDAVNRGADVVVFLRGREVKLPLPTIEEVQKIYRSKPNTKP